MEEKPGIMIWQWIRKAGLVIYFYLKGKACLRIERCRAFIAHMRISQDLERPHKIICPSLKDMVTMLRSPMMGSANTSIADYVWLPVTFDGDMPKIKRNSFIL